MKKKAVLDAGGYGKWMLGKQQKFNTEFYLKNLLTSQDQRAQTSV